MTPVSGSKRSPEVRDFDHAVAEGDKHPVVLRGAEDGTAGERPKGRQHERVFAEKETGKAQRGALAVLDPDDGVPVTGKMETRDGGVLGWWMMPAAGGHCKA